ncbi:MAG: hypothetical protein J6X69_01000 [Bacteroidales bacterium]|nr:hypothetical protein [Bacteroidales bacterium]
MKKKNIFLLAALAGLLFAGCNKTPDVSLALPAERTPESNGEENCTLRIRVQSPDTKTALAQTDDNAITNLQVLVFRENGSLDIYAQADGDELTLQCTSGNRDVFAFVNTTSLSDIRTTGELGTVTFNLEDSSPTALPMYGHINQPIDIYTSVLSIDVYRMVCKIILKEVVINLPDSYSDALLDIRRVFISNAVSGIKLDSTITRWANKISYNGEIPTMLSDDEPNPGDWEMSTTDSQTLNRVFYAFANDTASDSQSATWSPRFTRLVLQCSISNDAGPLGYSPCYYPVPLPDLKANHCYIINRYTVGRGGLQNPYDDPTLLDNSLEIIVKPWDQTHQIEENL